MSIVVDNEQFNEDSLNEDESMYDYNAEEIISQETSDDLEANLQDDVPEKFKGKELKDVVSAYTELEKEFGRKNNEVGELRKLTDDFLKQQLEPSTPKEKSQIDLDNLLENPDDVITNAVDNNPRIAAIEEALKQAKIAEQRSMFESKHDNWQDVIGSTDFQKWISSSPVRQNMYNQANNYDYAVADELLNLYGEIRGAVKEQAEEKAATKRQKALRNTSTSKGSTGEVSKKIFKRADLVRLKQQEPSRYNEPSFQEEVLLAYQEGRVR